MSYEKSVSCVLTRSVGEADGSKRARSGGFLGIERPPQHGLAKRSRRLYRLAGGSADQGTDGAGDGGGYPNAIDGRRLSTALAKAPDQALRSIRNGSAPNEGCRRPGFWEPRLSAGVRISCATPLSN